MFFFFKWTTVNAIFFSLTIKVEDGLSDIDAQYQQEQDQINVLFSSLRGQLSQHILGLTIQEIRNMGVGTFDELNEASVIDPQATISSLNSTGSIQNTRLSKLTRKNQSKDDEGLFLNKYFFCFFFLVEASSNFS